MRQRLLAIEPRVDQVGDAAIADPGCGRPWQSTATKKASTAQPGQRRSDAFGSSGTSLRSCPRSARCPPRDAGGASQQADRSRLVFEPLWTDRSPIPATGHQLPLATDGFRASHLSGSQPRRSGGIHLVGSWIGPPTVVYVLVLICADKVCRIVARRCTGRGVEISG
jgi:hypothetical protein